MEALFQDKQRDRYNVSDNGNQNKEPVISIVFEVAPYFLDNRSGLKHSTVAPETN